MHIIRAESHHVDAVLAIMDEAAAWLQSRGINQWPHPFPCADIERRFTEGDVYIALVDDQLAGTFTLYRSDPAVWGQQPADALYLHGLAVRRKAAGRGLGHDLLRHAEQIAAAQGKRFLRLDCWAGNSALRRLYTAAGFTERGVVEQQHEGRCWECRLFEKTVC